MNTITQGQTLSPNLENFIAFANGKPITDLQLRLLQQFGWVTPDAKGKLQITIAGQHELQLQQQQLS